MLDYIIPRNNRELQLNSIYFELIFNYIIPRNNRELQLGCSLIIFVIDYLFMKEEKSTKTRKRILCFLAFMCLTFGALCMPVMAETTVGKPVIITNTITDATTSVQVYGEKGSVLYVKNKNKIIAKKKYNTECVKTISMKA